VIQVLHNPLMDDIHRADATLHRLMLDDWRIARALDLLTLSHSLHLDQATTKSLLGDPPIYSLAANQNVVDQT
jgi:hypothetical protein